MGYTLARQNAYRNAQPTSHETFLLPSSGELENRFDRVPTSVFQRARLSRYFSSRGQFLHSRFVPVVACRTLNRGVIFWRFAGEREAQKKLRLFCRLTQLETTILHVNGKTAKTSSWEPFHGSCSNSCESRQQIPPFDTLK